MILTGISSSARCGLDIAMDDTLAVGVGETLGHLLQDLELARRRERLAPVHAVVEVLAGQVFLHQIRHRVLEAEVEDGDDVAVLEIAGDLGLAVEPLADVLRVGGAGLDRYATLQVGVAALVNAGETAGADLAQDLVLADLVHAQRTLPDGNTRGRVAGTRGPSP
jgi:hypothetical protein